MLEDINVDNMNVSRETNVSTSYIVTIQKVLLNIKIIFK